MAARCRRVRGPVRRGRTAVALAGVLAGGALLAGCGGGGSSADPGEGGSLSAGGSAGGSAYASTDSSTASPSPEGGGAAGTLTSGPASTSAGAASPSAGAAGGDGVALFFGDSNFVGGGCTPDPRQDMAQQAADQLGYTSVFIRGAGGTGFASGNEQYGLPDFVDQVAQGALSISPAPGLVVIEGGSNDTGQPLAAVTANAESVLRTATSTYPRARVVLMGPIDVRAGEGDVTPQVVQALQTAAGQVGVPFLDAYNWLPWRTTSGLVCSDYDHASPAGQRILGDRLAQALRELGA